MHKDVRQKIALICTIVFLAVGGFLLFLSRAYFPGADGYNPPDDISWYHISGKEQTWSFCEFFGITPSDIEKISVSVRGGETLLVIDQAEKMNDFIDFMESEVTIVDERPRAKNVRYDAQWQPYVFELTMKDGQRYSLGISMLREISRVACYDEEYYELLAPENFYFELERLFGMKCY